MFKRRQFVVAGSRGCVSSPRTGCGSTTTDIQMYKKKNNLKKKMMMNTIITNIIFFFALKLF